MELGFDALWRSFCALSFSLSSRRSFRGTTAFYFALVSNWRAKGGAKTTRFAGFGM
jgi:hypothetical protein